MDRDFELATKAQVLELLNEGIAGKEKMKTVMKDLTKDLTRENYTFDQVYQKAKSVQLVDPLETTTLTVNEFEQLLDQFQHDPNIRDAIAKIMGAAGPMNFSSRASSIPREKIVEIYAERLKELKQLVDQFQQLENRDEYDTKTVTIAAWAIVSAKIEKVFDLESEEIESAIQLHYESLLTDAKMLRINVQMQSTMSELIGTPFPTSFF